MSASVSVTVCVRHTLIYTKAMFKLGENVIPYWTYWTNIFMSVFSLAGNYVMADHATVIV